MATQFPQVELTCVHSGVFCLLGVAALSLDGAWILALLSLSFLKGKVFLFVLVLLKADLMSPLL